MYCSNTSPNLSTFLTLFSSVLQEEQEQQVEQVEPLTDQKAQAETLPLAENKHSVASLPLPPFDPDTPLGEIISHSENTGAAQRRFLFYYERV